MISLREDLSMPTGLPRLLEVLPFLATLIYIQKLFIRENIH